MLWQTVLLSLLSKVCNNILLFICFHEFFFSKIPRCLNNLFFQVIFLNLIFMCHAKLHCKTHTKYNIHRKHNFKYPTQKRNNFLSKDCCLNVDYFVNRKLLTNNLTFGVLYFPLQLQRYWNWDIDGEKYFLHCMRYWLLFTCSSRDTVK